MLKITEILTEEELNQLKEIRDKNKGINVFQLPSFIKNKMKKENTGSELSIPEYFKENKEELVYYFNNYKKVLCRNCGKETNINLSLLVHNEFCSRGCVAKFNAYYNERRKEALLAKHEKDKNTFKENGLTISQERSIKAANNRKYKQEEINKNISRVFEEKREEKEKIFFRRRKILEEYFGIEKFISIFVRKYYKDFSNYINMPMGKNTKNILKRIYNENELEQILINKKLDNFDELTFIVFNIPLERNCFWCDNPIRNDRNKIRKEKVFCSNNCIGHYKYWLNPEFYRNLLFNNRQKVNFSENMKERWEPFTSKERKDWVSNNVWGNKTFEERQSVQQKANTTRLEKGIIQNIRGYDYNEDYLKYRLDCQRETYKNIDCLKDVDKTGRKSYHVDHIFSISLGYYYNIPPYLIGHHSNLQVLDAKINRRKSYKIGINIPERIKDYLEENEIILKEEHIFEDH